MNANDGKRNATRYRLVVGGVLALGTALLGLSGASGHGGSGTQAAVVRAQGATPAATITFPSDPSTSTTTTVPPTTAPAPQPVALAVPAPAPAAAPEPAPAADPAPAAEPAPTPASGDAVLDAIAQYFPDVYDQAVAVARCESSLDPNAVSAGGYNWGLFQINVVHKSRVEAMGYSWDQILDPYVNAAVARSIYDDAGGWGPWGCRRAAY